MNASSRFALACLLAVSFLFSSEVSAQPTPSGKAVAEKLFQEGRDLLAAGNVALACNKLAESQRLDPNLSTLLNLAHCHEEQGKTADAWVEFKEAITLAERVSKPKRAKYAKKRAQALEPRLSYLRLRGRIDPDATVRLDGVELGRSALESALPVNPGEHRVELSAPGFTTWSRFVALSADGNTLDVDLPKLQRARAERPVRPREARPARAPARAERDLTPAWIALGVGTVALGVGTYFGLRTLSQERDADEICPGRKCATQAGIDRHAAADRSATISTISFAVGAVATAVGVGVFLWPEGEPQKASTRIRFHAEF